MSHDPKSTRTPDDIVKERLGVSLTDAVADQVTAGPSGPAPDRPDQGGPPQPTHADVAQQTHMQQQDRPDGTPVLDLPYVEDSRAEVDMNVVMLRPITGGEARFVEVQGTAEGMAFTRTELDELVALAEAGLLQIADLQAQTIAVPPTPRPALAR